LQWNPDNVPQEQPADETEELLPVPVQPEPPAPAVASEVAAVAPEPVAPEPVSVQPEPEREPVAVEPEPEPAPAPEKTSLLKREISFRRKPKQPKAASEPELDETSAEPKKTSLLKKEISFGRKPKEPKQPKEPKAKKEKAPKAPKPKGAGLKKEISLSFGRKKASPAPIEAAAEPQGDEPKAKAPRKPRGKRDKASSTKRTKRLVGLKIGGSQLAAARIVNNGSPELVQVARERLDHGIVVGGELREPELLADALRAFFRKHKLPRQGVRLGIANNRIGVRIFEIAGISDPKQLENAIRFRAQEALPIPIEEAVLDYHVLGERTDEEGQLVRRILLVVAYRELIDRYVAACKKAGVRLAGIDLEAFALLRALGDPLPADAPPSDAALVVVSVGHDRSTFAVSDGRVCEFTRVLDWGGSTLDVAVARELHCAPSEAEPVKRELSLAAPNVPEGLTQEQADRAREAIRRQLQGFARELVSSLQFYQNQPGSLGIGEIVITGGTAHLPGVAEELQRLIGVRVEVGDPLQRVKLGKKLREADEQLGSLAVAIGLGIED
jgi:type IV pilus assembly protein PilM